MLSILDVLGGVCVLGGAVQMVRALVLHTDMSGGRGFFKPAGSLTPEGRRYFFMGIALLVLGHVLKDVVPALVHSLEKGAP